MSLRVELTTAQQAEYWKALENLPKIKAYQGECKGCHRRLPHGYVPIVTKWVTSMMPGCMGPKASELWCRTCGQHTAPVRGTGRPQRVYKKPNLDALKDEKPELPMKEIAQKLWPVLTDTPHGSKKLCELAGIERTNRVLSVLKQLLKFGKVALVEGRWTRKV